MKSLERNDMNGSCFSFIASFRSAMTLRVVALLDKTGRGGGRGEIAAVL